MCSTGVVQVCPGYAKSRNPENKAPNCLKMKHYFQFYKMLQKTKCTEIKLLVMLHF